MPPRSISLISQLFQFSLSHCQSIHLFSSTSFPLSLKIFSLSSYNFWFHLFHFFYFFSFDSPFSLLPPNITLPCCFLLYRLCCSSALIIVGWNISRIPIQLLLLLQSFILLLKILKKHNVHQDITFYCEQKAYIVTGTQFIARSYIFPCLICWYQQIYWSNNSYRRPCKGLQHWKKEFASYAWFQF